jgi:hypothetical protein
MAQSVPLFMHSHGDLSLVTTTDWVQYWVNYWMANDISNGCYDYHYIAISPG